MSSRIKIVVRAIDDDLLTSIKQRSDGQIMHPNTRKENTFDFDQALSLSYWGDRKSMEMLADVAYQTFSSMKDPSLGKSHLRVLLTGRPDTEERDLQIAFSQAASQVPEMPWLPWGRVRTVGSKSDHIKQSVGVDDTLLVVRKYRGPVDSSNVVKEEQNVEDLLREAGVKCTVITLYLAAFRGRLTPERGAQQMNELVPFKHAADADHFRPTNRFLGFLSEANEGTKAELELNIAPLAAWRVVTYAQTKRSEDAAIASMNLAVLREKAKPWTNGDMHRTILALYFTAFSIFIYGFTMTALEYQFATWYWAAAAICLVLMANFLHSRSPRGGDLIPKHYTVGAHSLPDAEVLRETVM